MNGFSNGFSPNFIERGAGFPLILLHGNGEDASYFSNQINVFAERFHVFCLDTRGHGKSPRGDAPFTLSQFADDLLSFMDAHDIEKAYILGFSDGGNIALLFALRHPERVERLILNGANLRPSGVKLFVQAPIVFGWALTYPISRFDKKCLPRWELLNLMVTQPHIDASSLRALQTPTLVVAGTRDMIRARHTRKIAESLPNARLVFLQGDHFVAAKAPEAFNRAVLSFLCE